eukprot:6023306-Prymnesium_polylepis.2
MKRPVSTCFALLGLAPGADVAAIKDAYRRLAKEMHPDISRDPAAPERFREVSDAYAILLAAADEASAAAPSTIDGSQGPAMRARWNVRRKHTPSEYPAWFRPPDGAGPAGERSLHTTARLALRAHPPHALVGGVMRAASVVLAIRARRKLF